MKKNSSSVTSLHQWRERYQELVTELAPVGYLLQGTITTRVITRPDHSPNKGSPKSFGPYYQWTWKNKGKTVTVNLSAEQAVVFQQAIDNNQRLQRVLAEMRDLSVLILEATTPGVTRRKYRSIADFKT